MSLRHAILGFLSLRPLTGYDLKRYFDNSIRHFWSADQAGIYRALNDLSDEGLVTHERVAQQTRPDRKVFHATSAGLAALDAWLAAPAPAVVRREPLLIKLFFAKRLAPEALRQLLEEELASVEAELETFRGIVASIRAEPNTSDESELLGPLITLTNGVRTVAAQRDWLRALLGMQVAGALTAGALFEELAEQLQR